MSKMAGKRKLNTKTLIEKDKGETCVSISQKHEIPKQISISRTLCASPTYQEIRLTQTFVKSDHFLAGPT